MYINKGTRKYQTFSLISYICYYTFPLWLLYLFKSGSIINFSFFSIIFSFLAILLLFASFYLYFKNEKREECLQGLLLSHYLICVQMAVNCYEYMVFYYLLAVIMILLAMFNFYIGIKELIKYWNVN